MNNSILWLADNISLIGMLIAFFSFTPLFLMKTQWVHAARWLVGFSFLFVAFGYAMSAYVLEKPYNYIFVVFNIVAAIFWFAFAHIAKKQEENHRKIMEDLERVSGDDEQGGRTCKKVGK
jgi:ABC-type multidrug transport system permease subunit